MVDKITHHWHVLDNGKVQCDLCPRHCQLNEGQHGFCFVRMRKNNQIVLTNCGEISSYCVDPIEKKPLYHFLPGSSVLSFGMIGCNLDWKFCQNWQISRAKDMHLLATHTTPESIVETAQHHHCQSVAFTYNEPIIFMEYAMDTAQACREAGIKTVIVTNGYICEKPREEFFKYIDAANVDLKSFNETFYFNITKAHLQPVLETLEYLKKQTKVWLEITHLLIPNLNDSEHETEQLAQWIVEHLGVDVPLHFSAFFPTWKMQELPPTPPEALMRAREIALKNGLRYVYTGNINDPIGSDTYCHHCGQRLIQRTHYKIVDNQLTKAGHCPFCDTPCSGIFTASMSINDRDNTSVSSGWESHDNP